jgi:hypothetical protein
MNNSGRSGARVIKWTAFAEAQAVLERERMA